MTVESSKDGVLDHSKWIDRSSLPINLKEPKCQQPMSLTRVTKKRDQL